MKFFKNKTNVILALVLLILIGVGVILGIKFFSKPALTAVDFTNMSEQEIIAWAEENDVADKFEIEHEYDENVPAGGIIYQSIKEGEEIPDSVLIIISDGPDLSNAVQVPDDIKTIEAFENWAKENNFVSYKVEYNNDSEKEEGTIISINPMIVRNNDVAIVTIASNKNIDVPDFSFMSDSEISDWAKENNVRISYENEKSDLTKGSFISQSVKAGDKVAEGDTIKIVVSKGKEDEKDSKTATIDPTKYLGTKEEDFLKALKELGFTNVVMIDEINSTKYDEGTICYYLPDDKQKLDTKIEYKVSLGKDGKPTETAKIDPTKYLGVKEEEFLKELEELGFKNVKKIEEIRSEKYAEGTICYYLPDGKQRVTTTIEYKVSVGKDGTPSSEKTAVIDETGWLGKTEEEFLEGLKKQGFTNIVKIEEVKQSKYKEGTICYYLPDGKQKLDTKIEYKVVAKKDGGSTSDKTATIDPYGYLGKSEESFLKALKDLGFTNIVKIGETTSSLYKEGTICYYLPDGKQKLDTKIEYKTVKKKDSGSSSETTPSQEKVTVPTLTTNPCGGTNTSCSLENLNYSIKFEESTTVSEGQIISISPAAGSSVDKNSTVTIKVSSGASKKYIDTPAAYRAATAVNNTVDATESYMKSVLNGFDVSIVKTTSTQYDVGKIISISVGGSTSYSSGSYPLSTEVIVTISTGYAQ